MNHLRAMGALATLDLRRWFQSPAAIGSALLPPLGMALLLAVLSLSVTEQPVALVVESHGPYAGRMAKLIRADKEAYRLIPTDAGTADRLLRDQEVAAVITIPADFDRKAPDHAAVLQLKLNNIDIDFADDIRRSVDRSAGQFDAPRLGAEAEGDATEAKGSDAGSAGASGSKENGARTEEESEADEEAAAQNAGLYTYYVDPDANPYHIQVEEHDLRVTNVDFLHYQLVPVLVLLVLNISMTGTALLCAEDGERGTARLLVTSPVSPWALVAGHLLGGLVASLIVLLPVVGSGLATHAIVVPAGHWTAFLVLLPVIALSAAGLGAGLGAVLRGRANVAMASSVLATYLFFMGGGFTTIAFLPRWLRILSAFDPMRYAIDGLRQVLFYPDLTGFGADLAVLVGTTAGAILLGAVLVIRSWRR
jgi:ABC-2 type transport system permease protein